MRVLVTGSAGHLGEVIIRTLQNASHEVVGLDIVASHFTSQVGSIADRAHVKRCMEGVDAVLHTAALHKPHVITHGRQDFVDTNITGTLNLLEEAASVGVVSFVFTSTTRRIRRGSDAPGWSAGGVGDRGCHARSQEHLRRDKDCGGESL
jgi:UDP-glucose 4-epimerase